MGFFISDAYAQAGGPGGGAPYADILFLVLLFAVFYFLLIRPQQKKAKEHKKMVEAVQKGDEVITNGGIAGKVIEVGESFLTVNIAEGVDVKLQRSAIAQTLIKGTIKSS
ncbi:MAG: preprotein translocase subunit YajC [Gammaproteobacteria bacterium]|nr:preprotein translocase subunit YajC [Gammaproteobacteria bacterium]NIM71638.1 preprotein translocase subunit YajC [Gammaproteobacteria bacterium]NIO23378.1 preprotein translocase subunit YajC [Gammaproteobacteria bacterium]NIO64006.1 preprotein translocase subunit YajC [Gammaproteobacteria bacterium]NIP47107.1 preprotein translocase subunit YajC [Gammaproteobacteria bacterium]